MISSDVESTSQSTAVAETDEDLSKYLPLYKAAQRGDWETAKNYFDKNEKAASAIVSVDSKTALHVAVLTGKANDFVKKLVELMPEDALALKNCNGDTALHFAAMVGNKEAAIALVNKKPGLLYILNYNNRLPVLQAAIFCQKDMLECLISMSKPKVEHSPFEGQLGVSLLTSIIASEFLGECKSLGSVIQLQLIEYLCFELYIDDCHSYLSDVALHLVNDYPDLARSRDECGRCALSVVADTRTVFPSGESFSWWQRLIYRLAQKLESVTWKVVEHLAPQVKDIKDKKAMHQQALELVKYLCEQMASLPEKEARTMFHDSIIRAAKYGISEIVELIVEIYPPAIFAMDDVTGRNIFHIAASYRFENVFNLIYNMDDSKYVFFDNVDHQLNNLMHICGKLAPPHRLNLVSGAALQLQQELQWFKEMEKIVRPSRRVWLNCENRTPQMLFTEEHQQLKVEGEKWMKDTANACTIAAALATIVFAAAFTVPGGVDTNSGTPVFWHQIAFVLFAISDAVSLFTSITSLLMFLSILTSRYAEEDFLYVLPRRLCIGLLSLFISMTFMMGAFSATLYLVFCRKLAWLLIPMALSACLPIASFVLLQFPLLVEVVYSTYGPGIFGKKSDRVQYYLTSGNK